MGFMANHSNQGRPFKQHYTVCNPVMLPTPLEMTVADATIAVSQSARNIGAMFDSQLNMEAQVNSITRSCYVHRQDNV